MVLSPLGYTGCSAGLIDGGWLGVTPLVNQYSGRHISHSKSSVVYTVSSAPGTIGKIQVGALPGGRAQVTVPAWGVPLAAGTEPNAPVALDTDPPEVLLAQA